MLTLKLLLQVYIFGLLVNNVFLKKTFTLHLSDIVFTPGIYNTNMLYHDRTDLTYYLWNKTAMSSVEYQMSLCKNKCGYEMRFVLLPKVNYVCQECECEQPACDIYDNCCEEVTDKLSSSNSSASSPEPPKLYCEHQAIYDIKFLYIRSCPVGYHDTENTTTLCLNNVKVAETTPETFMRVIDTETQVVYYNMYCARCNNVTKPKQLLLNATCTSYMSVYMAENINDLIRLMLLDRKHCSVYQKFYNDSRPLDCYTDEYGDQQVGACDRNDSRKLMDPDIVAACDNLKSNKYQILSVYNNMYYRNIFCMICNLMSYPFYARIGLIADASYDSRILYQMLINFEDLHEFSVDDYVNKCNETTWPAPNGECLQLRCSLGKTFKNGTCTSIFPEIKGLVYRLRTLLKVTHTNNETTNEILDLVKRQVNETFKTISDGYSYQLDVVQEVHGHHSDNTTHFVRADIFILASSLLTRDSFENIAVDLFFGSTFDEEGNTFRYYNVLTEDLYNNLSFTSLSKRVTVLFDTTYSKSFTIDPLKSIILSSTLTCSFLTFQQTNFTVKWNISNIRESVNVTLDVGGTKLAISNMSDISSMVLTGNSELNICTDILDKYVNKTRSSGTNRPMDGVLYVCAYVLTYICLSASELCLFITLITYLVFAELRTVPGINNIFLTLSLFLAQLALIMASNVPTPSALCTYTGIITHFLWLWHFTWSFLCSLHMFRVFTAKTRIFLGRNSNVCSHVIKVMTFSLCVSVSVVALVIVSSHLTSHTIGYGKKTCYLDSAFLIGVAMVAPLSLVFMCNLTFLVITVVSIHRVNTLLTFDAMKKEQYQNLILYVKLSSVTSVYWIVTIVAEAVDSDVLRHVEIPADVCLR